MRDQGRLVEWFDDKGFGFIQPNDASKGRVFLHIKDFAQRGIVQSRAVLWNMWFSLMVKDAIKPSK